MEIQHFVRQIFLPKEIIFKIKAYCVQKSMELNKTYELQDFYADSLRFLKKFKVNRLVSSFHYQDKSAKPVIIHLPLEFEEYFINMSEKLASQVESFSERKMVLTAILLFLKEQTDFKHEKLEEVEFA